MKTGGAHEATAAHAVTAAASFTSHLSHCRDSTVHSLSLTLSLCTPFQQTVILINFAAPLQHIRPSLSAPPASLRVLSSSRQSLLIIHLGGKGGDGRITHCCTGKDGRGEKW